MLCRSEHKRLQILPFLIDKKPDATIVQRYDTDKRQRKQAKKQELSDHKSLCLLYCPRNRLNIIMMQ